MSEIMDKEFVDLFEKNVTFESKEEAVIYWKGIAYDYHQKYKAQEDQYNEFRMFSEQLELELEISLKTAEDKISCLEPKSSALEEECQKLKENLRKIRSEDSHSISRLQDELQIYTTQNSKYKTDMALLQIENDKLEKNTKIIMSSLTDIESKLSETVETNFYLQQEITDKDSSCKREMQRMMDELRDMRTEMTAREKKRGKIPSQQMAPPPQIPTATQNQAQPFKPLCAPTAASTTPSPLPEGNRLQALSILGDILRKVGSVESRLASCKTSLSKDILRRPRPSSPTPVANIKRMHVQVEDDFIPGTTEVAV
ncbi:hypothetical protein LOD99_15368 [Oopsacas minuta]|uniref:NUDE domain-containing protein n=1 Tax=Oopsacas minuta TaxID=111878 RepID=A0AAV7KCH4_9METZ|nr:hypothetical protein LOD99_15368 [Oopsacas minuta]